MKCKIYIGCILVFLVLSDCYSNSVSKNIKGIQIFAELSGSRYLNVKITNVGSSKKRITNLVFIYKFDYEKNDQIKTKKKNKRIADIFIAPGQTLALSKSFFVSKPGLQNKRLRVYADVNSISNSLMGMKFPYSNSDLCDHPDVQIKANVSYDEDTMDCRVSYSVSSTTKQKIELATYFDGYLNMKRFKIKPGKNKYFNIHYKPLKNFIGSSDIDAYFVYEPNVTYSVNVR